MNGTTSPGNAQGNNLAQAAGSVVPINRGDPARAQWLRSLIIQVTKYAPGSLVPAILGLIGVSVYTRVFGSFEYGEYSYLISIVGMVGVLSAQWLQHAITRFIPGESDPTTQRTIKHAVFLALGLTVLITLVISIPLAFVIKDAYPEWYVYYWPSIGLVIVTSVLGPLNSVFQAELRAGRHTVYNLTRGLIHLSLSLLLIFWVYPHPVVIIVSGIVSWVLLSPFIWRDTGMPVWSRRSIDLLRAWSMLKAMWGYGMPLVGWYVFTAILNNGDRYVIQYSLGSEQLGIYSANYGLVNGSVGLVATPIILAAQPMLMAAWQSQNRAETAYWLAVIVECLCLIGALVVGVVSVFARDIAGLLLGPEFRSGYQIIPLALAGIVLWQISLYLQKPLEFAKQTKVLFWSGLSAACVNVLLNLLMVPRMGYLAAAYTTILSYLVYALAVFVIGRQFLHWSLGWSRLLRIVCAVTLAAVAAFVVRGYVTESMGAKFALAVTIVFSAITSIGIFAWGIPPAMTTGLRRLLKRTR